MKYQSRDGLEPEVPARSLSVMASGNIEEVVTRGVYNLDFDPKYRESFICLQTARGSAGAFSGFDNEEADKVGTAVSMQTELAKLMTSMCRVAE